MPLTWQLLDVYQGEDKPVTVKMSPATSVAGWSARFRLLDAFGGNVLLEKTTASGAVTVADVDLGWFNVKVDSAETLALAAGQYYWEFERTDSGNETVVALGILVVNPSPGGVTANPTPPTSIPSLIAQGGGSVQVNADGSVSVAPVSGKSLSVDSKATVSGALTAPVTDKGGQAHNVKAYGAKGDGVTDDSTAFAAAESGAGAGGRMEAPAGTYVLNNWAPTHSGITLLGAGPATVLKSKAGAAAVMTLTGLQDWQFRDLVIDGNAKASEGLIVQGGAALGSQRHTFHRVTWQNCSTGFHVASGTVNQADKNTFVACQWNSNTTGCWINSTNAQQQLFLQPEWFGNTTGVRLTAGGVTVVGGQGGTQATGFLIDGLGVTEFSLRGFIDEGVTVSIDGSDGWPGATSYNVLLEQCVLGSTGSTDVIKIGQGGSVLRAVGCRFNTGAVHPTANDVTFFDDYNTYANGAAYNPTAGTNQRRHLRTTAGETVTKTTAGVTTQLYNISDATGALTLTGAVGLQGVVTVGAGGTFTITDTGAGNADVHTTGFLALDSTGLLVRSATGGTQYARWGTTGGLAIGSTQNVDAGDGNLILAGTLAVGGGDSLSKTLKGTATWDPPNLTAGTQTTQTLTVTGAALTDHVLPSFSLGLQGMQLTGYVSATDTVTVVLRNGTAGAIDLASGTLAAVVVKR